MTGGVQEGRNWVIEQVKTEAQNALLPSEATPTAGLSSWNVASCCGSASVFSFHHHIFSFTIDE